MITPGADRDDLPDHRAVRDRRVLAGARGGTYAPGTPRAPFDHHERYLRDFIAGHYDVTDVRFLHAELTNALVDPLLAACEPERIASREAALLAAGEVA